MFACKNCGGNTRYDIKLGKCKCDVCSSLFPPEELKKDSDSIDYDFFETTVFTCPQCGAKIMAEDNEAASFCTYCCSATVLTSQISKEKKPDYIIPFKKTKEECIEEFKKITKRAVFAPREIRDEKVLNSFKAIYMPYWYYDVTQDNPEFTVSGMEKMSGMGATLNAYFEIKGSVEAELEGFCKDASYEFSDDISERISPYFTNEITKFYPSYLSGFYADVSDIPPEVYEQEILDIANDRTRQAVSKKLAKTEYADVKVYLSDNEAAKQFNSKVEAKRAFFPVWFMSFKKENKVAYMTVNGQTGVASSDLPISTGKFILATLLLTLLLIAPAAVILFLFMESVVPAFLDIMLLLSIPAFIAYYFNMKNMQVLATGSEDAGKFYNKYEVVYLKKDDNHSTLQNFYNVYLRGEWFSHALSAGIIGIVIISTLRLFVSPEVMDTVFKIFLSIVNITLALIGFFKASKLKNVKKYFGIIVALITEVIVLITMSISLLGLNMVGYIGLIDGILVSLGGFFMILDLVKYHNELVMRKPAHLKERGGDEIANRFNVSM